MPKYKYYDAGNGYVYRCEWDEQDKMYRNCVKMKMAQLAGEQKIQSLSKLRKSELIEIITKG